MNQMAMDFRYQLSKRIEENDCLTPRIMRAMLSDKDGDLAETMGDHVMEPFIKKMNSFELLEQMRQIKLLLHPLVSQPF